MKIKHGKDYKQEKNINAAYPVLGTGGVITYIDSFLCDWNCVCIGRKGTINKPIYMDEPFWSVDTLFYSIPNVRENPKFQYYLFQTINWLKYNAASGVPSLSSSTIESIPISRPFELEQKKISTFLTVLDNKIKKQEELIEAIKSYKRGALQTVFNKMVLSKYIYLSDVCTIKKGTQLNKTSMLKNGSYYVLNGGISPSGYTNKFNSCSNTISISEGGNSCGFVNFNFENFWSGGHCYTLENINNIDSLYLYQYLKYNELRIMELRVGSGLPNIQKKELEKFPILYPSDNQQKVIGYFFSQLDKSILDKEKNIDFLKELKDGLLQKMFI